MDIEINLLELSREEFNNSTLIDVREDYEREVQPIDTQHVHLPLSQFDGNLADFAKDKQYLIVCAHGMRSSGLTQYMRENGFAKVFSIPEGIETLYQFMSKQSSP